MSLSKKDQLGWNKAKSEKKLSKAETSSFIETINRLAKGKCQICENFKLDEYHHAIYGAFGANKDDRSLVGICRGCHYLIHHSRSGRSQEVRQEAIVIGNSNWEVHNGEA